MIVARVGIPRDGKEISIDTEVDQSVAQPTHAEFEVMVADHLDGFATSAQETILAAFEGEWVFSLWRLLNTVDANLRRVESGVNGPERALVVEDFTQERDRIREQLTELTGVSFAEPEPEVAAVTAAAPATSRGEPKPRAEDNEPAGTLQLQLSWTEDAIVAWLGGHKLDPGSSSDVVSTLDGVGVGSRAWDPTDSAVPMPGGKQADALSAPIGATLGWLVAVGANEETDEALAPSAVWLGRTATLAVRLVAQGRMVPEIEKLDGGREKNNRGRYAVRWAPALIGHEDLNALAKTMPGAVSVLDKRQDARALTRAIIGSFIDVICSDAAGRIEVPAPPPNPRTAGDVAEAVLARFDGAGFEAPAQHAAELGKNLRRWAEPVSGSSKMRLIVQLDPPDSSDAWYLKAMVASGQGAPKPVNAAMSDASSTRREMIKRHLDRLETLYAPLLRGKAHRRGEVILSQDEAWELMTVSGRMLRAAGFEVRVPPLRRKKAVAGLMLTSISSAGSVVGADQLSTVRWSAVFDGVELSAEEIRKLAAESRPLVKAHGRWVEIDHADLEAAAEALAERANQNQFTGADMLRHALGLEDSPLAGGFSIAGESWATDLLRSAKNIPESPETKPEGFVGELRTYQADALAWMQFLDGAGLGGCLALDMGLGKTPTMLAHLALSKENGKALVIAPPAVVTNWAAEAAKFTPDVKVLVHHGANRAELKDLPAAIEAHDVLITTYGTAVRDIEALIDMRWGKVVLDEAQIIKNHTSDTAQQLRRLEARTRVALTGTPIENGLGDLWALMDFVNPGLVGGRNPFVAQLSNESDGKSSAEQALRTLNGVLVFRRTKMEPAIAAELPDRIDELDHCAMTSEQVGLYQAVLDELVLDKSREEGTKKKGAVLAAITALKQICNHPEAYLKDGKELDGRSGKLARLNEIIDNVFANDERVLIFTHFASWGEKLAEYQSKRKGVEISCYHGGLSRGARDRMIEDFQNGEGPGALVLSLKAGGTGLNLTAASHVVLYDRWWNPAVEDQARDRAWRIGQTKTVVCHRLVCPGTVDERVEEVVAGKRKIADMTLPKSSSVADLDDGQLRQALGIDASALIMDDELEPVAESSVASVPEEVSA